MIELLLSIALLSITHPGSFEYPIVQQERFGKQHFNFFYFPFPRLTSVYKTIITSLSNN
jgi:hypothetical protein